MCVLLFFNLLFFVPVPSFGTGKILQSLTLSVLPSSKSDLLSMKSKLKFPSTFQKKRGKKVFKIQIFYVKPAEKINFVFFCKSKMNNYCRLDFFHKIFVLALCRDDIHI